MSSFKYLVCLDFEATCWPGKYTNNEKMEIIEIAAILLNVENGNFEDQFHCYVRPNLYPTLSEFCVNLTGITQATINCQDKFPVVCEKFIKWIHKIQSEKGLNFAVSTERRARANGINATFCSWSNWDLNFFFKQDCQRAAINTPLCLKAWIDVREMYDQKYPHQKCPFSVALKRANINAVGKAHSGISDATNLAKMVMHLINGGIKFEVASHCYV